MKEFDVLKWEREQDEHNIDWILQNCKKGCTKEQISVEDATCYYNDCIKKNILYHRPEDSETLKNYINAYNFFNRWA